MKKIEAIIRSSKFDEVKEALKKVDINFFSFYEVKGDRPEKDNNVSYRGLLYDVGNIGRIKLEIILPDNFVKAAFNTIKASARTGEKGDGLVVVTAIDEIVNVRTGLKSGLSIL